MKSLKKNQMNIFAGITTCYSGNNPIQSLSSTPYYFPNH